jgi:hypothetical protein
MAQESYQKTTRGMLFCSLQEKWPEIRYDEKTGYAFIPETGQNLAWDNRKQAWIDVKTLRPVSGKYKTLKGAAFACCLQKRWSEIRYDEKTGYAFVPETGQNLAWDKEKQAWIDVKTGECICPSSCPATSTATAAPPPTPSSLPPTKPTPIFVRNYQPGEVFAGYMFLRAPGETAKNGSGFAAQMFYKFKPNLGIGGDLACAWGSGRLGTTIDVRLQRCTHAFGPQINTNPTGKVQFFFHPLVGVVRDANKRTAGTVLSKSEADALVMEIGGGFDVKVSHRVEVRPIQVDFQPTHFGGSWQQNWRLMTGIVIRFGKDKEIPTW